MHTQKIVAFFERKIQQRCIIFPAEMHALLCSGLSLCNYRCGHVKHKAAGHHHHAKGRDSVPPSVLAKRDQQGANHQKADAYAGKAGHLRLLL
jgi:hypothetical protein